MLKASTELFWNGLWETRNWGVEMRNGLKSLLVPDQFRPQFRHSKSAFNVAHLNMKVWLFIILILFHPLTFRNLFQLWKVSLICCLYYYSFCWRGSKHFDVNFWSFRPVKFPSKHKKEAANEGRGGCDGVYFPPESAIILFEEYL